MRQVARMAFRIRVTMGEGLLDRREVDELMRLAIGQRSFHAGKSVNIPLIDRDLYHSLIAPNRRIVRFDVAVEKHCAEVLPNAQGLL